MINAFEIPLRIAEGILAFGAAMWLIHGEHKTSPNGYVWAGAVIVGILWAMR